MLGLKYCPPSDIGNRITELSKATFRMHSDVNVVRQLLVDDARSPNHAFNRDGSSLLRKYIMGAKNNFRGFHSSQEDKTTLHKVTVHHGEVDKEREDSEESDIKKTQVSGCGAEGSEDCDAVNMEEGRAKAQLGDNKETVNKEQVEAERREHALNETKEVAVAGACLDNGEEMVKGRAMQDEADMLARAKAGEKPSEARSERAGSIAENTDIRGVVSYFRAIELQEQEVEAKWRNGRTFEPNVTERSDVRDSSGKKIIPSPTGSSSSQDTGFGSGEGEESIDSIVGGP